MTNIIFLVIVLTQCDWRF